MPSAANRTEDQEKVQEAKAQGKRRLFSTGKCPICGEQRKHLHAHLATRKKGHGWSTKRYERWLNENQSKGRKDRHMVRECPKDCGWSGVKLERHLKVHHDVEPKSQAMAKLKANSKGVSREEHLIKQQAGEETSTSKKIKLGVNKMSMTSLKRAKKRNVFIESSSESEETSTSKKRKLGVNKNSMTSFKRAKKRTVFIESSSESEQDQIEDGEDAQETYSNSAQSSDERNVSDNKDGQNDGSENDGSENDGSENDGSDEDDEEEENLEDDKEEENLGKYGPSSRPTNVFETLLRGWNIHLATPDGTEKTPVALRQMCHHVSTIAKAVDPSAKDLGGRLVHKTEKLCFP